MTTNLYRYYVRTLRVQFIDGVVMNFSLQMFSNIFLWWIVRIVCCGAVDDVLRHHAVKLLWLQPLNGQRCTRRVNERQILRCTGSWNIKGVFDQNGVSDALGRYLLMRNAIKSRDILAICTYSTRIWLNIFLQLIIIY